MRLFRAKILATAFLLCASACQNSSSNSTANPAAEANRAEILETSGLPPFATKEPERYSARVRFAFRYGDGEANFIEQNYTVTRDGANRRLDFETGGQPVSRLQTADGKIYVLLVERKIYAELAAGEATATNLPADASLEHLLHARPAGATFERIGEEEVKGRKTIKYKLNFGAVKEAPEARTETFVWADETLGLPVKTEVIAIENNQPSGKRNVLELDEIKTEVDPNAFQIPKDFRKVSFAEIQKTMK